MSSGVESIRIDPPVDMLPAVTKPVVVMVLAPLLIVPKLEVMEPASKSPT